MSYNDSDDSDGQGFIPNKMIIKARDTLHAKEDDHLQNFQPHYITGEIVIKKEPPECYAPISVIQRQPFQISLDSPAEAKGELPAASELYLSENYELAYSRFRKPFSQGRKAAFTNQIIIKSTGKSQHFRTLKNWRSDSHSTSENSQNLIFDSKFEGGNLLCAFRSVYEADTYILFMQNDTNTYGYNQWFYFSVRNTIPNKKYTFKIVNFKKNYSFFKKGMQPYIFSLQESKASCGWYMDGSAFSYFKSNFEEKQCGSFYTLSFQIQFRHANDFVMLASSLPYSYSKLINQLQAYQAIAIEKQLTFELKSVCKTLGGNEVPYIQICKNASEKKKIIVITARQHSGEIWSSYLMDELLKGLASQQDHFYQWVIDNYDFHIFPMINVDGVIYGNFRCDLAGYDLNRCWKDPSPILQPHIHRIRQKVQALAQLYPIHLYLDLHTHSKEHGVFAYSCVESDECRKLPLLISTLTPLFRYPACTFGIAAQKKTTARSQIFELSGNINTVTIELSAFGYRHPTTKMLEPFTINNIKAVAQAITNSIYYYQHQQAQQSQIESFITESHFPGIKQANDDNEAVSGSDSDPEVDAIEESVKVKKILKELKKMGSKIKSNKTRVKKLKTNMNFTSSPEPQDLDLIRHSPISRNRAVTESKEKKDAEPTIESRQLLSSTCAPQRTSYSFKKIFKGGKFCTPGLLDASSDSCFNREAVSAPKPLNLIEFSLKKLPIYNIDRTSQMFPMSFDKNFQTQISSISFAKKAPEERIQKNNKVITFYRSKKEPNLSSIAPAKDPLQFLCVMSESKKKEQIQRIKDRKQQNQQNLAKITNNKTKFALIKQSTVLERYARDKKIQNSQAISKTWLNNFNRYSKSLEDSFD